MDSPFPLFRLIQLHVSFLCAFGKSQTLQMPVITHALRGFVSFAPAICRTVFVLWGCLVLAKAEAVPLTLTYQGQIVVAGAPYEGVGHFKFALIDGSGATVWSNDGSSVLGAEPDAGVSVIVSRGVYSLRLGDSSVGGMESLSAGVFDADELSVRIWFKAGSDPYVLLTPDRLLGSVAFSVKAASADYAAVAGTVESVPNISAAIITSGTLSDARLPASLARDTEVDSKLSSATFDASKITSGTLSEDRIGSGIARVESLSSQVAALQAQIDSLAAQSGSSPSGSVVVASQNANDSDLLNAGYVRFSTVSSNDWSNGASGGQPSSRVRHSSVWTGDDLIVWGGEIASGLFSNTGGIYNPAADTWSALSTFDSPVARSKHSAVWTGTEMLIWGGVNGSGYLSDGKRFDPDLQLWSPMSAINAPTARAGQTTVWTGTHLVIWGGVNEDGLLADGSIYYPDTDTWENLPSSGAPVARQNATAVWTGDSIVVFGGTGVDGELSTGARLTFSIGVPSAWQVLSNTNAPNARSGHSMVWSGSAVLVFGGENSEGLLGDGFAYDPAGNSWSALSSNGAPTARREHSSVWIGSEMIVVGGNTESGTSSNAFAYSPVDDSWRSISGSALLARAESTVVWIGDELVVFGGIDGTTRLSALQRIDPSPTIYLFRIP